MKKVSVQFNMEIDDTISHKDVKEHIMSNCSEYNSPFNKENFFKWALDSGWKEGLNIDRIFLDGNYEPKNCQWISISNNSRKKSTTKLTFERGAEIRKRLENVS